MSSKKIFLGLGSNLGDKKENLLRAVEELSFFVDVTGLSSFYSTAPIGPEQDFFLNAVLLGKTNLEPHALLLKIKELEIKLGRKKTIHWGPRLIDIDILWMDGRNIASEELNLPHAQLTLRRFVLEPLYELAGNMLLSGKSLLYYLNQSLEQSCEKI